MFSFFMGVFIAFFLVSLINFLSFAIKQDVEQKQKYLDEMKREMKEEEEDTYAMVGSADRPRPKGKHCPLHNYTYYNDKLYCTWCNKYSSQLLAESSGE